MQTVYSTWCTFCALRGYTGSHMVATEQFNSLKVQHTYYPVAIGETLEV